MTANRKAQEDAKAHPLRRFILKQLATVDRPVTAEELRAAAMGIPEPQRPSAGALNYHLVILVDAGFVVRVEGTGGPYALTEAGRKIA